jgi:hypothetical protein
MIEIQLPCILIEGVRTINYLCLHVEGFISIKSTKISRWSPEPRFVHIMPLQDDLSLGPKTTAVICVD